MLSLLPYLTWPVKELMATGVRLGCLVHQDFRSVRLGRQAIAGSSFTLLFLIIFSFRFSLVHLFCSSGGCLFYFLFFDFLMWSNVCV